MSDSAPSSSALLLPGTPCGSRSAQFQTLTTSPCMHWDSRHLLQPWRLPDHSLFSSLSFCVGYSSPDYPLEMQAGGGGGFLCPENESCGLTPHFRSDVIHHHLLPFPRPQPGSSHPHQLPVFPLLRVLGLLLPWTPSRHTLTFFIFLPVYLLTYTVFPEYLAQVAILCLYLFLT